jgi:DNA-binding transcriptional LysR family regulator
MSSLPPLPALKAFLAACRTGSYTAAAEELSVTHGAVSRQIQVLEQWLGQKLFEKSGQRMVPTLHAQAFAREMGEALERIGDAARRYGKGSATEQLRVSAPATFAMRWLIPRLPVFHAQYPGSVVQVMTVTTQQMTLAGSFDLAIRRAPPPAAHFSAQAFYEEWQTLIAAPLLLAQHPLDTLDQLADHVLLETETRPGHSQQWLNTAGYVGGEQLRRQRFDHFFVTLTAVIDGLGVGIGPMPTVAIDIAAGRLCTPFSHIRTDSRRYYALTPLGTQKTLLHRRFEEWLIEQGQV